MIVKLGKWEKGATQRIYFNHESLGSAKAYGYADKETGQFLIGYDRHGKATVRQILNVIDAASKLIEEKIASHIGYNTKFDDVWSSVN